MKQKIRLILDPPRAATLNMAVDEMLMGAQKEPAAVPALRIYSWDEPSVSIGYFQNVDSASRRFGRADKPMSVVRRLTGGGLVFHGADLTFSLTLKNPNPFFQSDTKTSYLKINEALRVGWKDLYPSMDYADCKDVPSGRGKGERICFEAPACYDLLIGGKKAVGASQRRIGGVILHQSAVFLDAKPDFVAKKMLEGFEKLWDVGFEETPLTGTELVEARRVEVERYSSPEWACPTAGLS